MKNEQQQPNEQAGMDGKSPSTAGLGVSLRNNLIIQPINNALLFKDALLPFLRDLMFECPALFFRLGQLYFERFVLKLERFALGFKADYFFAKHGRKGNIFQQVNNTHVTPPMVNKAPNVQGQGVVDMHWSDCAVHNEPAYPAGECDCGWAKAEHV